MMPEWAASYLSIPFAEHGRTRLGVDCYGLVRLIYQEQRGIELPSYVEQYATTNDADEITALLRNELTGGWREIRLAEVRLFDGLILRLKSHPTHFAMVLDPPWFIHAATRVHAAGKTWIERWDSMMWRHRVIAAARWQGA